ncbi:acetyl-CoA C-acetyltransferase [Parafrankia irregularis]|uniref:Acetyl-CoA C-acetyltransferase n=1 Tax=Parafrankia irregularis TaxID=795642 RepID=A0A0S4QHJ8_9ACTN|nr:enoyl-CoA hydratase-related protein [Parafrankia irregularis]CUU55056.1 acetyl-CoA C-acetyltransferase [Parafrankia irregularis]
MIVGVGQSSERIGEPDYRGISPVGLATQAACRALADAGGPDASPLRGAIDLVAGVRQFDNSSPTTTAPLGRPNNFPRAVARRLGAAPRRALLDVAGGHSPQHLVNDIGAMVATGEVDVALLVGAEAISTVRHLVAGDDPPDFSEQVDGDLEDRGHGRRGLFSRYLTSHALATPAHQYALFEEARRARLGLDRASYARTMGALFAPFSAAAACHSHASAPTARSVDELATPSERNRLVVEPYTRALMARENVNQGAAVLITSIEAARRLGVPEHRWVFLHGHADLRERDLLDRQDLSRFPAGVAAVELALEMAGITLADLTTIDLYSCFPIAVSAICDELGLAPDDPRGLTVTGGLPFFGGAGNNYAMHAIATTVERLRVAGPTASGLVGANGGMLSKYSVGVYSRVPRPWAPDRAATRQDQLDAVPVPGIARNAEGWGTVETGTLTYHRDGRPDTGIVVGRLDDGRRFLALVADGDDDLTGRLAAGTAIGTRVYARALGVGNRVAVSSARMERLLPRRVPTLRGSYEFLEVRRDDHVLEVVINRPERRNALHPPANDELEDVFDAYFADRDLWVAIITGAGDTAFSAGSDMIYHASGNPMWVPVSGFGGLTRRAGMNKPVIAAVNGFAFAGGFEIVLACHLVVADELARFALSEAKVGLAAGEGGLVRLPRAVGPALANELVLTGRPIGAQEAHSRGLVNRVAPAGQALPAARELAAQIIASSPTSIRVSLDAMAEAAAFPDPVAAVSAYSRPMDDLFTSEDSYEGRMAFVEKRAPRWVNR